VERRLDPPVLPAADEHVEENDSADAGPQEPHGREFQANVVPPVNPN
jgi:hypothetical protein